MNPDTTPAPLTALTPGRCALLITLFAFVLPLLLVGGGLFWPAGVRQKQPTTASWSSRPKLVRRFTLGIAASGKWLLLLVYDAACDAVCIAQIITLRAIQVSLGGTSNGSRRVVLIGRLHRRIRWRFQADSRNWRGGSRTDRGPAERQWSAALAAGAQHRVSFSAGPGRLPDDAIRPDTEPSSFAPTLNAF